MPPAAQTGVGATASITCGRSAIVPMRPGVAARLGALRDDDVGAAVGDAARVLHVADEADDLGPLLVERVGPGCWIAEPCGEHRHLQLKDRFNLLLREVARADAPHALRPVLVPDAFRQAGTLCSALSTNAL